MVARTPDLRRLIKGLLVTSDLRGLVAVWVVPPGLIAALGFLFSEVPALSAVALALTLAVFAGVLHRQWRAEQDGSADQDRRRHEEHKGEMRALPLVARVLFYSVLLAALAVMAWTKYRYDW